ncbi:SOS response-associated peptidase [Methanocalculus sp.]|uniref:SOS response-associated peptidase n=1 Tax=Methanocalculus sp. TaxID=2004547 RepID=UPI002719A610|nr:SOS response-associated peptidase [Methanocalculus sp.]MDO8842480.1 SOS response-associated peptidase [Methanocalculus sp.]
MCSRYTIIGTRILAERFGGPDYVPRYNAAPGQSLPVITGDHHLRDAIFGIKGAGGIQRINARIEGISPKIPFGLSYCLIPADGFFEWKGEGMRRQPYYFSFPEDTIISFAGLYDELQASFCIVTTSAIEPVRAIHQRMPYILSKRGEERWIRGLDPELSTEKIDVIPVDRRINNPETPDDPVLIHPATRTHAWW